MIWLRAIIGLGTTVGLVLLGFYFWNDNSDEVIQFAHNFLDNKIEVVKKKIVKNSRDDDYSELFNHLEKENYTKNIEKWDVELDKIRRRIYVSDELMHEMQKLLFDKYMITETKDRHIKMQMIVIITFWIILPEVVST